MEVAGSTELLVPIYQIIWRHISDDHNIHILKLFTSYNCNRNLLLSIVAEMFHWIVAMYCSSIYFGSSLIVVAPRPKLLPGWMVPIHPFSFDMWCALGVSFIVCTAALHVTSQLSMRLLGQCDSFHPIIHIFLFIYLFTEGSVPSIHNQVLICKNTKCSFQEAVLNKHFSWKWRQLTAVRLLMADSPTSIISTTTNLPGGKGQPACKADNITAICEPIV
jgi:hypothetical protein